jgi:hypothetical protein
MVAQDAFPKSFSEIRHARRRRAAKRFSTPVVAQIPLRLIRRRSESGTQESASLTPEFSYLRVQIRKLPSVLA